MGPSGPGSARRPRRDDYAWAVQIAPFLTDNELKNWTSPPFIVSAAVRDTAVGVLCGVSRSTLILRRRRNGGVGHVRWGTTIEAPGPASAGAIIRRGRHATQTRRMAQHRHIVRRRTRPTGRVWAYTILWAKHVPQAACSRSKPATAASTTAATRVLARSGKGYRRRRPDLPFQSNFSYHQDLLFFLRTPVDAMSIDTSEAVLGLICFRWRTQ